MRFSPRPAYFFSLVLAVLSLPLFNACAASPEPEPAVPPRVCVLVRGLYCIQNAGLTIREEKSAADGAVVIMYREFWRENPAVIIEPSRCDARVSDTLELLDYSENHTWRGQQWGRMVVRLHSGGRCDFQLLFPGKARDEATMALWTLLGEVRACHTEQCSGIPLAERIGDEVRRRRSGAP